MFKIKKIYIKKKRICHKHEHSPHDQKKKEKPEMSLVMHNGLFNLTAAVFKMCSCYTVARLGCMLPQLKLDPEKLREELTHYQVADSKELPQEERVDRFWGLVGKEERFSQLGSLMEALLCIPHSNASSERTFSTVKKIHRKPYRHEQ